MKKNLLSFLWVLLLIGTQSYAQNRTITGTVIGSDDGLPLAGVSVTVKGTKTGTQTNVDGKFSIAASGNSTLVFSFVGFEKKEVQAANSLKVSLKPGNNQLSEVVVVGYGTQERKNVTGAVSSIKGSALTDQPVASFDQALSGKVAGAQVTVSSGLLGSAPRIRIRGTNSITNGADPLYVLDGVPIITGNQSSFVPTNPLGDINPNDIQSVEVLKDGSATAIYGSRASNGVILITTKKGVTGKPKITYDAWFASARTAKKFDLLDADQFVTIANEKLYNVATAAAQTSGSYKQAFTMNDPSGNVVNTDWQKVVFHENAFQQNHSLSISGATDQSNYYFSLGYANLDGIISNNNQKKYQVRGKIEQKALNNHVTLGVNTSVSYVQNYGLQTSTTGLSSDVSNAIRSFPNVYAINPDGSYNLSSDNNRLGRGANTKEIDDNYTNVKYVLDHNIFRNQNVTLNGSAFLNVNIIKGLDFKTLLGTNGLFGEDYEYLDPLHGDGGGATKGYEIQQYIPSFRYNWVNTLSYNKVLGKHNIGAVAGYEIQHSKYRSFYASGSQISSTFFGGQNIIDNSLQQPTFGIGGGVSEQSYKSYFGRVNYTFNDKYLLSATYRADAISSLPIGQQYAYLPGGSLGWRISKESFFQNAKALKFIDDLKIRGGYAKVGNTDIGNYPSAGIFGAAVYGNQSGLAYSQVGNSSLKFETTDKFDVGFDASFLNSRITLSTDYYVNKDNNLILAAPTAPSLGVPKNSINENVGTMSNKGIEVSISSVNIKKQDFSWSTDVNFTYTKNKILSLANNNSDLTFNYNIDRVGQSVGAIYGYQSAGVNPANGNPLFVKSNGQLIQGNFPTGKYYNYDPANPTALTTATTLTSTDRKILGNANPTYFGGLNNTVTYKGFDFSLYLTYSGGNKIMNITRQESLLNQKFQNNGTEILNRWTTPGQITNVPKLYYQSDNLVNLNGSANSRFVEDGKFLRAQNIVLGYSVPKEFLSKIAVSRLRIYAEVQNAFVITGYKGLDPELNTYTSATANSQAGLDYNTNPKARTFLLGINVGF